MIDEVIKIIDEISILIKDNIQLLYLYRDDCLTKLKKYCNNNPKNKTTPSDKLIEFADEALIDLRDTFLYDFRDIE